jgi:hypothetical protein
MRHTYIMDKVFTYFGLYLSKLSKGFVRNLRALYLIELIIYSYILTVFINTSYFVPYPGLFHVHFAYLYLIVRFVLISACHLFDVPKKVFLSFHTC